MGPVSYSGLGMYTKCPSSFHRKYNLKEEVKYPPTRENAPAMFRGTDIHNSIEHCLLGEREDVHEDIHDYLPWILSMREHSKPELEFAFDLNWEPVAFDAEDARIRGFMDNVHVGDDELVVHEWKTGKMYDEHSKQRNLYGLACLILFPKYDKVRVITVYLDQRKNVETTYHMSMISTYKYMWDRHINKVYPPQPYPMRPGWYCRFCNYSKNSGGKCPN